MKVVEFEAIKDAFEDVRFKKNLKSFRDVKGYTGIGIEGTKKNIKSFKFLDGKLKSKEITPMNDSETFHFLQELVLDYVYKKRTTGVDEEFAFITDYEFVNNDYGGYYKASINMYNTEFIVVIYKNTWDFFKLDKNSKIYVKRDGYERLNFDKKRQLEEYKRLNN